MTIPFDSGLMWFRRDLRLHDNAALAAALGRCRRLHCVFVFDRPLLAGLPEHDRRVEFIRDSVRQLDDDLRARTGDNACGVIVLDGVARDEIPRLARELGVGCVFANHDDEPEALARDGVVRERLAAAGIGFADFKDHAIFERRELLTRSGSAYTVFTPYRNAWLGRVADADLQPHAPDAAAATFAPRPPQHARPVPTLAQLGFAATNLRQVGVECGSRGGARALRSFLARAERYGHDRDLPALDATSHLGVHLRFGTVSIREAAGQARRRALDGDPGAQTWLDQLIWRDFFLQVLANFPRIAGPRGERRSFRPAYDAIEWERGGQADALLQAWCEGRTGYPLVDAAMAQLNETGFMHNRLRMVTASFLVKDLGIDWRRGEAYFARHLTDYELASNNGGWQWCASSGCDAQPWFRIFNPVRQSERFDADGRFIARWLPQLARLPRSALHAPWTAAPSLLAACAIELGANYPAPIVDHEAARERTLRRFEPVRGAR